MTRHRWIWIAATTVMFGVAFGWNVNVATAPIRPVDWAKVNPAFAGATFVNDDATCETCHAESMVKYAGTAHAHALALKDNAPNGRAKAAMVPGANTSRVRRRNSPSRTPRRSPASASNVMKADHGSPGRPARISRLTSAAHRATS